MPSITQLIGSLAALIMSLQGVVSTLPPSKQVAQVSSPKIGQVLGASTPELPRAYVDTSIPSTSATCTINVQSGGNLQAAIDSAKLGDTICVQAGATFVGPFILPKKTSGSGWVTIRTSTPDASFVSPGTRVSPSNSPLMPKLVSPGFNEAVIQTGTAANNYRLIGLEITKKTPDAHVTELIVLGDWRESRVNIWGVDTKPEDQPYNIVIDRMYIHGDMTSETKRGVRMHCNNCAVIDSHISQIQSSGQDTQAVLGWNSQGPFKIVNNYLEATGENVMFGGGDPSIHHEPTVMAGQTKSSATLSSVDGLSVGQGIMFTIGGKTGESGWTTVRSINGNTITFDPIANAPDSGSKAYFGVIPSDFEIRKNYFVKPRYWNPNDPSFAGKNYAIKNLFETKSMNRVLIDSNIFEGSWISAQTGYGIIIKSHNQDGNCPYCFTQDVTFTNNVIKNVTSAIMIQGTESYNDWNKLTPFTKRVKIENNLFYNEPTWNEQITRGVAIFNYSADVEINHNTIFSTTHTLLANYEDNTRIPNFVLTNNIMQRGASGLGNAPEGKGYLDTYFPNYTYAKNVLINISDRYPDSTISNENLLSKYPAGTLVTNSGSEGFVDSSAGNFKLNNSSPYKNAGTDGKDIGVDMDALNTAIVGVKGGNVAYVPPVATDTTAPTLSSIGLDDIGWISASVTWNTSEPSTGKIEYGGTPSLGSSVQIDSSRRSSHNITIEGLTPGTTYYYKVKSSDASLNEAVSELKTFKTKDRLVKPPKPQSLNARKGSVILEWSSVDYDLCRNIKIYRSTSGYPSAPNESNLVATLGCSEISFRDVNVTPNTYYYSLFVVDDVGVYSDPMNVQFVVEAETHSSVSAPVSSSGGGGGGGSSTSSSSGRRNVSTVSNTNVGPTTLTACTPSGFVLNRNLAFRSEGEDVKNLQSFLVQKGYTTADNITGFFGPITIDAVKKLQRDNNIVSSGDYRVTGYGMVGPVTRLRINSMLSTSCNTTQSGMSQSNQMLQDQIKVLQKQVEELLLKLQQVR